MTSAQIACSTDDGATWTDVHATGSTSLRHLSMFAWPDAAPTHLILSDQAGVYLWDGSSLTAVTEGVTWPFTLGVATDDDRLFAVDHGGRVMESPDGGASWADTGGRLSAPVRMMRARPDLQHFPDLLAGGVDGTFVIHEGTVERYAAFQSVDDGTQYVTCPTCVSESTPDAILGEVRTLAAPGTTEVNLRGTSLVVRGKSRAGAEARVWVDGTLVATPTVTASEDIRTALIQVDGLEDRWHRLEIEVDVGEVSIDTYEGSGPGALLATTWDEPGDSGETGGEETADTSADTADTAPPDETGDPTDDTSIDETGAIGDTGEAPAKTGCGCAAEPAPATPWVLLLGALAVRRRRSRHEIKAVR
jgi:MYXO-CTERM domain-containing protein